jgi:geranylgeranyl reductase family protein
VSVVDSDVLVVGAGPAGATAARTLAAAGARVRLLDRARFPRNKPCGGAISMRALGRFPYLASALDRIPTHRISRLHLESPGGDSILVRSPTPAALMIRRIEFDELLVRLAVEAGAELVEGTEVTQARATDRGIELKTRGGARFAASRVIAADGVYSVVARRLGINPGGRRTAVALDMMEETPRDVLSSVDPDMLWVAYGYGGSEGYSYVFPKRDHVNVGIGYVLDYFRANVDQSPYNLQTSFVSALRDRGVLAGRSSRAHFTPYQIPVAGPLRTTATDRVVVAGDAGGFVNGITAEGIYYAMVTGDLAGRALVGAGARSFERLWRSEIGAELRDSVLVQRDLLTTPARIDRLIRAAHGAPTVAALIVRYAMGEVSYSTARRRLLLGSPMAAARLTLRHLRGIYRTAPQASPEETSTV